MTAPLTLIPIRRRLEIPKPMQSPPCRRYFCACPFSMGGRRVSVRTRQSLAVGAPSRPLGGKFLIQWRPSWLI